MCITPQCISDFMDHSVVGGGNTLVVHAKLSSQFGKGPLVQDMGKEDVAIPFFNLIECPLQTNGVALCGGIEIDVLRDQARDVLPTVIVAFAAINPVPCMKEVDLPPLNGCFQVSGKLVLQDVGFTFSAVPKFQSSIPPIYQTF